MDQGKYERSIDEVVQLGAKKIVLTGFGEPMLDKRLEDKIAYAHGKGLSTYFITNGSALTPRRSRKLMESGLSEMRVSFYGMPVTAFQVPIVRNISPLADVRALVSLYRLCRRQRFDAVHSVTPKAGLLAMLASRMMDLIETLAGGVLGAVVTLFRHPTRLRNVPGAPGDPVLDRHAR